MSVPVSKLRGAIEGVVGWNGGEEDVRGGGIGGVHF